MSLNDFELGKNLGKGAFASVILVTRKADRKIYAMKRINITKMDKNEREAALNEIRILKVYGTIDNLDPLFALNYANEHINICENNDFFNYLSNIIKEYTEEGNKYKITKNLTQMGLVYKEKEDTENTDKKNIYEKSENME